MGLVKREMEKYEAHEPGNGWILEEFGFGPEMKGTEDWREAKKAFRQHVRELRRQVKYEYDEWHL